MEIESASEAIDGDDDTDEGDPDSMDLLMGEIEIPFEPICDMKNVKIIRGDCTLSPCSKEKSEIKTIPNSKKSIHLDSLKKCLGYASANLFNDSSSPSNGFVRSGELKRTLKGDDPLNIPNEVISLKQVI